MPLVLRKNIFDIEMLLWRATETEEELRAAVSVTDTASVEGFGSASRRMERLAWRAALRAADVTTEVGYAETGAPYLEGSPKYLGVAHCAGMACVVLSDERCAVDIERADRNCSRVADRFMSVEERDLLIDRQNPEVAAWCVKEALYKYSGRLGLDFLEDIRLIDKCGDAFCGVVAGELATVRILHEEDFVIALAKGEANGWSIG